jgi:hypothetical protein
VDHIAVDAHHAEACGHRNRLVRHHPDAAGEPVHLHREGHRRVDPTVAGVLQHAGDAVRRFVHELAAAVELLVGHAARGRADIVAVHLDDQRDVALRSRQRRVDVLAFTREIGVLDAGEGDVVGTGVEAHLAQPVGVDDPGLFRLARTHFAHRRMVGQPGRDLLDCHAEYSTQYST